MEYKRKGDREEFARVLKKTSIDFAAAPETKKKLQGSKYVDDHPVIQWRQTRETNKQRIALNYSQKKRK